MNQPRFIYSTYERSKASVSASSSAGGIDPADILTNNEAVGWRPANAAGMWTDNGITDLPAATAGLAVIYNGYAYHVDDNGVCRRLNLASPTGAWDNAGVTDLPFLPQQIIVVGNYLYEFGVHPSGSTSPVAVARLDLTSPAGAWNYDAVSDLPGGFNPPAAVASDGRYIYAIGAFSPLPSKTYRLDTQNPTSGWSACTSVPWLAVTLQQATVYDNYLYATLNDPNSSYSGQCVVYRLDLANVTGPWEKFADLPQSLYDARAVLFGNGWLFIGGQFEYSPGSFEPRQIIRRLNLVTGLWDENLPVYPLAIDSAPAIIYNNRLFVFGGNAAGTPSAKTYVFDLTGEYVIVDCGQVIPSDSLAINVTGLAGGMVDFYGSVDNFASSSVLLGSRDVTGESSYACFNTAYYRQVKAVFYNYGSDFLLRSIAIGQCPSLPYMTDGTQIEGYQPNGKILTSQENLYLGAAQSFTTALLNPDWGSLLDEEKTAFDAWAAVCVKSLQPFFFVPDLDSERVFFCWTDQKYKYDPVMKKGAWEISKIPLVARA